MIYLVLYDPVTGAITQRVQASDDRQAALYHQSVRVPKNIFDQDPERRMRVDVATEELVEKPKVTITPAAPTFPADLTEMDVTLTGLIGAGKVRVGKDLRDVSPLDNVLTLTSDVVRSFLIYMDDGIHWSEPVTVRAV